MKGIGPKTSLILRRLEAAGKGGLTREELKIHPHGTAWNPIPGLIRKDLVRFSLWEEPPKIILNTTWKKNDKTFRPS